MYKYFVYAYSPGSQSAKMLAEALGGKRIRHTNSKYRGGRGKVVVLWGASHISTEDLHFEILENSLVINIPSLNSRTSSKVDTFQMLRRMNIPTVEWTTSISVARGWLVEGRKVVVRHLTRSSGGQGIEIIDSSDDLCYAPLYTKYFPKKREYRLHISPNGVFYAQRKVVRRELLESVGPENINWQIRNLENGFIFQRNDIEVPEAVYNLGEDLARAISRQFRRFVLCADVLYNERMDQAVVCELNSAPGLDQTSADIYAEEIKAIVEGDN